MSQIETLGVDVACDEEQSVTPELPRYVYPRLGNHTWWKKVTSKYQKACVDERSVQCCNCGAPNGSTCEDECPAT